MILKEVYVRKHRSGKAALLVFAVGMLLGISTVAVSADLTKAVTIDGKTYGNTGSKPANNKETITVPSDKYKTIQSAVNDAKEGTTIVIKEKSGGYQEQLSIKKNGITLKGEGKVKVCGNESMKYGDLLTVRASDIVVENIEFTGLYLREPNTRESAGGIRIDPGSSNVYILDCKIHDLGCEYNYTDFDDRNHFNGHGISVKGSESAKTSKITISGCEVYNLRTGRSESVVLNHNTEYFTLSDNYIHDNDNIGIDCAGGYGGGYSTDFTRNGLICGNTVKKISSLLFKNPGYFDDEGNPHSGADGIYVDGGRDIYIHDNYVTGCDIGLEIAAENRGWVVEGVIAENNLLVYNDQYVGLAIGGSDSSCGVAKNNIVRNNTVINSGKQHCLVVKVSSGNEITNNIFISKEKPANNSKYFSENKITDNASNRASDLPGTNTKININDLSSDIKVDFDKRSVVIDTDTDLSAFGCKGKDPEPTPTNTSAPTPKVTNTVTPTAAPVVSDKPLETPTVTPLADIEYVNATNTPTATPTQVPGNVVVSATATAVPTATPSAAPAVTSSPAPTAAGALTPSPSVSPSVTANVTATATPAAAETKIGKVEISEIKNAKKGVALTWNAVPDAKSVNILRSTDGKRFVLAANVDAKVTSYTDKKVTNGKIYYYKIEAVNGMLWSQSEPVQIYRLDTVKVTKKSSKKGSAFLKWKKNAKAGGYQIRYVIKNKVKTVNVKKAKNVSRTIRKLKSGKKYQFSVRAYKKIGQVRYYGNWSKTFKIKIK